MKGRGIFQDLFLLFVVLKDWISKVSIINSPLVHLKPLQPTHDIILKQMSRRLIRQDRQACEVPFIPLTLKHTSL